jgi:hypothetical protein
MQVPTRASRSTFGRGALRPSFRKFWSVRTHAPRIPADRMKDVHLSYMAAKLARDQFERARSGTWTQDPPTYGEQ